MTLNHQNVRYNLKLDLTNFAPEPFVHVETNLRDQGITITTLAAAFSRSQDSLHHIYILHNECRKRQPPVEQRQTPLPLDSWIAHFWNIDGGYALPDAYFVAQHETHFIGVSVVHREPAHPALLYAGFTGVLPEYAGRNVGLVLKIATILYAKEHGYAEIQTNVRSDNPAMLRINEQLGFQIFGQHSLG